MVDQLCEYTKNHEIMHFKWVNFNICKLYIKKVAFVFFKKNEKK